MVEKARRRANLDNWQNGHKMDDLIYNRTGFYLNCIRADFVTKVMEFYEDSSVTSDLFVAPLSSLIIIFDQIDYIN